MSMDAVNKAVTGSGNAPSSQAEIDAENPVTRHNESLPFVGDGTARRDNALERCITPEREVMRIAKQRDEWQDTAMKLSLEAQRLAAKLQEAEAEERIENLLDPEEK